MNDHRWGQAMEMLLAGCSRTAIASSLQPRIHRNTLRAWMQHPDFIAELQRRLDERDVEVRLRRSHQATAYADRVRRLADSALREAEQRPLDRAAQLVVRHWLRMYRQLIDLEREVVG